ncbi:iron ABC transporter permease [Nocardioides panacis]|uniref:Iron ABC transporter permease n=1 Tax=Nocardioides panacis TaxID=2849501 RepID=A0A975SXI2_9ACTN|nr:iron ABC transporter permease [Nocardioides panacis]QWZ07260.1 iron ABC transporter permease [Nocardioides panacis]
MSRRAGAGAGVVALAALPLAFLAVFFVLPVAGIVGRGFAPDGHLDVAGVLEVLGRPRVHRVLWFTVWSAALATVVTVLLGVPVAFVLYRLRFPGRGLLRAFVLMPFVMPTVVVGVAFRTLLASSGPLGGLELDGTPAAIIAAMVFFNLAVVVRTVGSLWAGLDRRREEAAAALGASPLQVLRTVTLPALLPGIVSAASVVFLFCATAFGVVLTLGGLRYATVETEIYLLTTQLLDLQGAAALSVLQLVVVSVLLYGAQRTRSTREHALERTGERDATRRPRRRDLPVVALTTLTLGFVAAPLLTLLLRSLRVGDTWGLGHYRDLAGTGGGAGQGTALLVPASTALASSWRVAVDATLLAMLLGVLVSLAVSRRPRARSGRRAVALLDSVFMLPLGVSAVTLGFGFLVTLDRPPLDLRSSAVLVPIAQAMVALPLVVRTLVPVLGSLEPRQRQAAASLGASPLRVALSVDLPVLWRPLLAATGFAFAVSLGEFGATSFLARPENPTLPVLIYQLVSRPGDQNFGMALAASVVLGLVTVAVMAAVERFRLGSVGTF